MRRLVRGNRSVGDATLRQVDRLIAGNPRTVSVSVSALPGKEKELLKVYSRLFRLRGYRLERIDEGIEGPFVVTFTRRM